MYAQPRTAVEVICSKEGCRGFAHPYDGEIYIFGGRSTEAIKKLEIFDPMKNQFTILPN